MSITAVDDGIWQGNLNAADAFFLVAAILAVLAAIFYAVVLNPPRLIRWAPVVLALAVGCTAFGLLVL